MRANVVSPFFLRKSCWPSESYYSSVSLCVMVLWLLYALPIPSRYQQYLQILIAAHSFSSTDPVLQRRLVFLSHLPPLRLCYFLINLRHNRSSSRSRLDATSDVSVIAEEVVQIKKEIDELDLESPRNASRIRVQYSSIGYNEDKTTAFQRSRYPHLEWFRNDGWSGKLKGMNFRPFKHLFQIHLR